MSTRGVMLVTGIAFSTGLFGGGFGARAMAAGGKAQIIAQAKKELLHPGRCDFLDSSVCLYPFPNNYFTVADRDTATGLRLDLNAASMPANVEGAHINPAGWNRLDGFSPGAAILVKVPGLCKPEALRKMGVPTVTDIGAYRVANSPVVVIDARTGKRWPIWVELDQSSTLTTYHGRVVFAATPPPCNETTLIIRPAKNFAYGTRYIVALRALRNASGKRLQPPATFLVYRDRIPTDIRVVEARRKRMNALFSDLQRAGIKRNSLYLAWDFTTVSADQIVGPLLAMRNDAFARLGETKAEMASGKVVGKSPEFRIMQVKYFSPCDPHGCRKGENNFILRSIRGAVRVPCYLTNRCLPGGTFRLRGKKPEGRGYYRASFLCNIPRSVKGSHGKIHAARAVLYGHGLFGSMKEINGYRLERFSDRHDIMLCAANWIGMSYQDVGYEKKWTANISLWPAVPARLDQAMVDFMYLGRAMIHPRGLSTASAFRLRRGHGSSTPVIDTDHLYYLGVSQGGILGGTLMALEPDAVRGALVVAGMNYSTMMARSVDFPPVAKPLFESYPKWTDRQLSYELMQMLWDRADPDGYTPFMTDHPLPNTPPHKLLFDEGWGDHQVTNWATLVEARSIGARIHVPVVASNRRVGRKPFWGIEPAGASPRHGSSATMFFWDIGPLQVVRGQLVGSAPPPVANVPNYAGLDPHEYIRSPALGDQISRFLEPGGAVINPCGTDPCRTNVKKQDH